MVERKHVLIVEDELPTLVLLQKMLADAGYRVTGVQDGLAALKAARAEPPDLVLLDLIIPGVDGYGVCSLLKRDVAFRAPVVILSGRTGDKDVMAAFNAGADAFLAKPIDRKVLLAKVSDLLSGISPEKT
jgi:DNA-binding response OmpR family regulator